MFTRNQLINTETRTTRSQWHKQNLSAPQLPSEAELANLNDKNCAEGNGDMQILASENYSYCRLFMAQDPSVYRIESSQNNPYVPSTFFESLEREMETIEGAALVRSCYKK